MKDTEIVQANREYHEKVGGNSELVGVFAGGTSGIGEATALAFARYIGKPHVILIGRSQDAADRVMERIVEANPNAKTEFLPANLTLMSEAQRVSRAVDDKVDHVDLLVLTSGLLTTERQMTSEGLDAKLAVNYYGRWVLANGLLDKLKASKTGARVVTVLAGGKEGPIDLDDLELNKKYSFLRFMNGSSSYNTLACYYLSQRVPQVAFCHVSPGFVNTPLVARQWFPLRWGFQALHMLGVAISPETSGERLFHLGVANPHFARGYHILQQDLSSTVPGFKALLNDENAQAVWSNTMAWASARPKNVVT